MDALVLIYNIFNNISLGIFLIFEMYLKFKI